MLQIKNTLGGGKPEGLYAWKKNNYAFTEKSTSGMVANTFITTEAQNKSIKYYYSSSYSYDNNTGMFVLENPTSGTVPYDAGISPPTNVYVTIFSPSSKIMIKTSSTSGKSTLYNDSSGVYFHITNANYPYTLFESERILSFLDYIVSDKETAYPEGAVQDGYYYEKVVEFDVSALGLTKYEIGSVTLTSQNRNVTINHSLGVFPKAAIILGLNVTGSNNINIASSAIASNGNYANGLVTNSNGSTVAYDMGGGVSSTVVKFDSGSNYRYFASGVEYKYIIFA